MQKDDVIYRQVAIDAIDECFKKVVRAGNMSAYEYDNAYAQGEIDAYVTAIDTVKTLPAVQPEQVCVATVALTDEQVKEAVEKAKNAVISVIEPEPHWIPCSEKMPSETVIATVETKAFKHRYVCEAVWIPRWTWKASFDEWEDCSEYNEDDDEYYVLEGWYERVHNWDEYAYVAIDDDVIAWMSMPIPYCGGGNGE